MKNKIISLFMTFLMMFSYLTFADTQSSEVASLQYSVLLETLEIVSADSYHADENVTRGDFVTAAIGLYGKNKESYMSADTAVPFADVSQGTELYSAVKAALAMGLISESVSFRPDDDIEVSEAVKILISLLGYAPLANVTGGYPVGYNSVAITVNLLKGIDTGDIYVNGAVFEKLIVNTLNARVAQFNPYSDNGVNISVNTGKPLMEQNFNMFRSEGLVDADSFTTLLAAEGISAGQLRINGLFYDTKDKSVMDYIGNYIEFYYIYDENTNKSEIIFAYKDTSVNKSVLVLPEDVLAAQCTADNFYYEDLNGNIKSFKLSANTSYIYNNVLKARSEVNLAPEIGSVELIDNNGDGTYEVVKVFEFSTSVVTGISINSMVITGKGNSVIDLGDINDYNYIEKNGVEIPFEEIKTDNVISYYESGTGDRYVRKLYVSENVISGQTEQLDEDKVLINGTEYPFISSVKNDILTGINQKYYVDYFGKIVYVSSADMEYVYGYLRGIAKNGLDGYKVKIFTENDRWVTLKLRDKVRINNDAVKSDEELYNSLIATDYHQLIKYKVNSGAEVVELLTAVDVERWSDAELTAIENDTFRRSEVLESNAFRGGTNSMGTSVYFGKGEKVFYVPDDITDESSYAIININQFFDYDENVDKLEVFDLNRLGIARACVLRHSNLGKTYSNLFVLEKVLDSLNSDGGSNHTLKGMFRNYNIDFETVGTEIVNNSSVKKGDIYTLAFNSNGEVINITKQFDITNGTKQKFLTGNEYDKKGYIAGEIIDVDFENNKIAIDYGVKTSVFDLSGLTNVYVYDYAREKTFNGSKGDLLRGRYIFSVLNYLRLSEVVIFE